MLERVEDVLRAVLDAVLVACWRMIAALVIVAAESRFPRSATAGPVRVRP